MELSPRRRPRTTQTRSMRLPPAPRSRTFVPPLASSQPREPQPPNGVPNSEPDLDSGADFRQDHWAESENSTAQHFAAARSSTSSQRHAVRRRNEEDNYKVFRDRCLQILITASYLAGLTKVAEHRRTSLKGYASATFQEACCKACGLEARECGPAAKSAAVTLVALDTFVQLEIPVFQCTRCSAANAPTGKLFHAAPESAGAFGGSPMHAVELHASGGGKEHIWFDLGLLDFLHLQRKNNSRTAIDSFTRTMFELHRQNCGQTLPSQDTIRKQLGKTLEEYENVLFTRNTLVRKVVEDDTLLGCCPACSGSAGSADIDQPANGGSQPSSLDNRPQIYADGNFKLPHLSGAGSATVHEPPIQHRFAKDSDVKAFCDGPTATVPALEPNECNEFDADSQLGRTKEKFDVTGVFGTFCRHGLLIYALNMVTGEKWSYATFILNHLLKNGIVPSTWWYKGHFSRWLGHSSLSEHIKTSAADIRWPLPTWHHSMHNAQCQATNSYRKMKGVGRGAGEPPEAAWSHLGPHGHILQYMSLPSRQAALERIAAGWNAAKLASLPGLLRRMFTRAAAANVQARGEIYELQDYAAEAGISEEQLIATVQGSDPAPTGGAGGSDLPWQAEYARLLLEQDLLEKADSSGISWDLLKATVSGTARLQPVNQKIKVQRQIRELEADHGISLSWSMDSWDFKDGLTALREHLMQSIQHQIAVLVQQLLLVEELFKRISNRRTETKTLQTVKVRQHRKIKVALQLWMGWEAVDPEQDQPAREVLSVPADRLHKVCRGEYPWQTTDNEGMLEVLQARLTLQLDLVARSTEEMELVKGEVCNACATVDRQLARIEKRRQEDASQLAAMDQASAADQQSTSGSAADLHAAAVSAFQTQQKRDRISGLAQLLNVRQSLLLSLQREFASLREALRSTHSTAGSAAVGSTDAATQADDTGDLTAEDQLLFGLGEDDSLEGDADETRMERWRLLNQVDEDIG